VADETRSWTVEEARQYLPRLRVLLAVLRKATDLATRARGNGHSTMDPGDPPRAGPAPGDHEELHRQEQLSPDMSPRQALDEISQEGIILRDPSRGLVDFPSRRASGRIVLLCWQSGEDDLSWWHLPEEGFSGRRPLPLPDDI